MQILTGVGSALSLLNDTTAKPKFHKLDERSRSSQQAHTTIESQSSQVEDASLSSKYRWDPHLLKIRGFGIWATTNVYWESAEEVGLDHGIPGVGHLGQYLQPQCWKMKNPPLTEAHVAQLHKQHRSSARAEADRAIKDLEQQPDSEVKTARRGELQKQWHLTRHVHNMVHHLRVELARDFARYLEGRSSRCEPPARSNGVARRPTAAAQEVREKRQVAPPLRLNTNMPTSNPLAGNTPQMSGKLWSCT